MIEYFTHDTCCPAHPDVQNKCTREHGPVPGSWAYISWWIRCMPDGTEVPEETEPPFAMDGEE